MYYFLLFIKKTLRYLLKPLSFVPALLVMYMIFSFSAQNGTQSSALSQRVTAKIVSEIDIRADMGWTTEQMEVYSVKLEHYVRKAAHFSEYMLLGFCLAIPFYVYGVRGIRLWLLCGTICVCYALSDEYHQNFSAGRSPSLRDVGIDSSGAVLGILISHILCRLGSATIFRPLRMDKKRR